LFCEALKTTTTANDIYNKLKNYLHEAQISMMSITSCATDGAPVVMGKKHGCLKVMKGGNPEMLLVHCVIHRENLVSKKLPPVINEILNSVIQCINNIEADAKCECLFRKFCEDTNAGHVRLLLHTEVNCLRRFMELFDILTEFLNDKPEMKFLQTVDCETFEIFHIYL
jgi:hypothetical protein